MTTSPRPRLGSDAGVSLVEMLVGMFVLGIVFAALASTMTTSMASIRGNESRTRATALANETLENMRVLPWAELGFYDDDDHLPADPADYVSLGASRPLTSRAPLPQERSEATLRDGTQYELWRAVSWFDDPATGSPQDYKQLRVEVRWVDGTATRTMVVEAMRAPNPSEQAASEFALSLVDAQPAIVYLDQAGEVVPSPGDPYAEPPVTLTAITNRPPDDFVYVSYRGGAPLALSGSEENRVWTRVEANQTWPNGDVEFTFTASRGSESVSTSKLVRFVRPLAVEDFTTDPAGLCFDTDETPIYPQILVELRVQGTVAEDEVTVYWGSQSAAAAFVDTDLSTGASTWTFTIPAGSYDHTMQSVSMTATRALDGNAIGPVEQPFPISIAEEGQICG